MSKRILSCPRSSVRATLSNAYARRAFSSAATPPLSSASNVPDSRVKPAIGSRTHANSSVDFRSIALGNGSSHFRSFSTAADADADDVDAEADDADAEADDGGVEEGEQKSASSSSSSSTSSTTRSAAASKAAAKRPPESSETWTPKHIPFNTFVQDLKGARRRAKGNKWGSRPQSYANMEKPTQATSVEEKENEEKKRKEEKAQRSKDEEVLKIAMNAGVIPSGRRVTKSNVNDSGSGGRFGSARLAGKVDLLSEEWDVKVARDKEVAEAWAEMEEMKKSKKKGKDSKEGEEEPEEDDEEELKPKEVWRNRKFFNKWHQKVPFPEEQIENEWNQRILALVGAIPQMRTSDFSEEDSPYLRQVLFNPRDNSNSFTNWRINQLMWRRHQFKDAIAEVVKRQEKERDQSMNKNVTVNFNLPPANDPSNMGGSSQTADARRQLYAKLTDTEMELRLLGGVDNLDDMTAYGKRGYYTMTTASNFLKSEFKKRNMNLDYSEKSEWDEIAEYHSMSRLRTRRMKKDAQHDSFTALELQRKLGFDNRGEGGSKENLVLNSSDNETRLKTLWTYSNSHGVSWDELDVEFRRFADEGQRRAKLWQYSQCAWDLDSNAGAGVGGAHTLLGDTKHAAKLAGIPDLAENPSSGLFSSSTVLGTSPTTSAGNHFPNVATERAILQYIISASRWRARHLVDARIAARRKRDEMYIMPNPVRKAAMESGFRKYFLRSWKRMYLRWFKPGQMIRHLRDYALVKEANREINERMTPKDTTPYKQKFKFVVKNANNNTMREEIHGQQENPFTYNVGQNAQNRSSMSSSTSSSRGGSSPLTGGRKRAGNYHANRILYTREDNSTTDLNNNPNRGRGLGGTGRFEGENTSSMGFDNWMDSSGMTAGLGTSHPGPARTAA